MLNDVARLNTKLEARELEVKDLIDDLRDGVSFYHSTPVGDPITKLECNRRSC